jgi:ATP-dependent DNA helicase RecG
MQPSLEKLYKFFKLEAERGYDNRAVVGGLNKILPAWEGDARMDRLPEPVIQAVIQTLNNYTSLETTARHNSLNDLWRNIQAGVKVDKPGNFPPPRPEQKKVAEQESGPYPKKPQPERKRIEPSPVPSQAMRKTIQAKNVTNGMKAGLDAPLTVIHGIGPKIAQTLATLGLHTLGDILYYFPRRYDDYSNLQTINRLWYGQDVTVMGSVQSTTVRPIQGGQRKLTEVIIGDGTGSLRVTWFNQPWIANRLTPGTQIVLAGKIDQYLGRLVISNPDWEPVDQEHLSTNRIVPVYPLTSNITQRWLRRVMNEVVKYWAPRVQEYLPDDLLDKANLVSLDRALQEIHYPSDQETLDAARYRLAFDEIFLLQLGVLKQKGTWQAAEARTYPVDDEWLGAQLTCLPYQLTNAQQKALQDVRSDLVSGHPMNRLLQGDVGSGKTIIAALAMAIVAHHGAQSAIMAPTSILAEQHYRNLRSVLCQPDPASSQDKLSPNQVRLLIGDTPENEKKDIRQGLADGTIKVVVGTHALLEGPIEFDCLQLVVIDEQHRFGVEQRSMLRSKGDNPHLLVMTATPIPRSLALTVYGDLDLSVMDELPPGRQTIDTHIFLPIERERAYTQVRKHVEEGHQVFVIYPLVEQGDRDEARAAVEEHSRLQKEIFPNYRLGLLHGRLKPEDKEAVMTRFRDGEFHILVSTSVVEVGVDIPNATLMIIEGANRFGLAQLHQFRGRVGRGDAKSYCILIPESDDAVENERLKAMVETNDGFILAERDLEQRGPGDFLGTRQSGYSELHLSNLADVRMIEKARSHAQSLFERDPGLESDEHQNLAATLHRFWGEAKGDIS